MRSISLLIVTTFEPCPCFVSLLRVLAFLPRPPGTCLQPNNSVHSREGAACLERCILRELSMRGQEGLVGTSFQVLREPGSCLILSLTFRHALLHTFQLLPHHSSPPSLSWAVPMLCNVFPLSPQPPHSYPNSGKNLLILPGPSQLPPPARSLP